MRLLWITLDIVLADQAAKFIVVKNMYRGQSIPLIGDWLRFTFTENPGMAFGITFGPPMTVTIFSLVATLLIVFYMYQVRSGYTPYRVSLAMVLGGALGNIIDRVFYGVIQGYGDLFVGKVVDFIHVSLWRGYLPDAIPVIGGAYVALFPIWNIADMAIVVGVVGILIYQKRFHLEYLAAQEAAGPQDPVAATPSAPPKAASAAPDDPDDAPRVLPTDPDGQG